MKHQSLKPLMLVGTASDVGKSILVTAFCRIFKQDGYSPAPFKAQNMSLNSFATPEGFEIGRAQATQAEAAGIACHTDMNPVLLKPTNHTSSQVVLNGKPHGNQSAYDYFGKNNRNHLFEYVKSAYSRLSTQYNPIVIEGAGSISELNLRHKDIVNMRVAIHTGARVILVADIDKGGVFASVYGSIKLLPKQEQDMIEGVIINKFRGDIRLFEEGKKIIHELTGKPVLGVLPYFTDITIEEEDSVAIDKKPKIAQAGKVNICVVHLPRMANYTDFLVFEQLSGVHLYYSDCPEEISQAEVIILPGSKNTIEDLLYVKEKGIDEVIQAAFKQNKKLIGICGGFQMMGQTIEDPYEVESKVAKVDGLGLLPLKTRMLKNKRTLQQTFFYRGKSSPCIGYEIHMGETTLEKQGEPLNKFADGSTEGYWLNNHCYGTYIHGIFDNAPVLEDLLKDFSIDLPYFDFNEFKQTQYDKLAQLVREKVSIDKIYKFMQK